MNRKILFRGKRKDNGKWTYGTPIPISMPDASALLVFDGNIKILEIVPETLGEYTGLGDKNNGAIFEGDIIKDEEGDFAKIIYDNELASFGVRYLSPIYAANSMVTYRFDELAVEWYVIGNIHDNPELIGGKEK